MCQHVNLTVGVPVTAGTHLILVFKQFSASSVTDPVMKLPANYDQILICMNIFSSDYIEQSQDKMMYFRLFPLHSSRTESRKCAVEILPIDHNSVHQW